MGEWFSEVQQVHRASRDSGEWIVDSGQCGIVRRGYQIWGSGMDIGRRFQGVDNRALPDCLGETSFLHTGRGGGGD